MFVLKSISDSQSLCQGRKYDTVSYFSHSAQWQ